MSLTCSDKTSISFGVYQNTKTGCITQILADAPPSPQTVDVIAGIETLMEGYISPKPQFKKVWQRDTGFLSHNCKEAKLHIIAYVKLLGNT